MPGARPVGLTVLAAVVLSLAVEVPHLAQAAASQRQKCSAGARTLSAPGSRVYPDVIVHHRGKPENLLVIEVKKSTSNRSDDADLAKLQALRQQLGYQYALFLRFGSGTAAPTLERIVWS